MGIFDLPPTGSWDEVKAHFDQIRDYIREAEDPNETRKNGETLLGLSMVLCARGDGELLFVNLLERGANPNKPSAWLNFTGLLAASSSISLVHKLVDSGLSLNEVHNTSQKDGDVTDGPATLLDHVLAIIDLCA